VSYSEMADKLYPDISVPEKAQKNIFSRIPGSLGTEPEETEPYGTGNSDTPTSSPIL
jgi:hypothetical protein